MDDHKNKPEFVSRSYKTQTIMARSPYSYKTADYVEYLSDIPPHLFFFMLVLLAILSVSWYTSYDHMVDGMTIQAKLMVMLLPLLLLLVMQLFYSDGQRRRVPLIMSLPSSRESIHWASGSAIGVALLLMVLLFMITHQSSFHKRWFPLITRY